MQCYLVGGAVRDKLLGIKSKDRDWVVVGSTPAEMLTQGYRQVGADFPVFLHPQTKEEYALARMERKSGQGYTGFICDFSPDVSLEDDLERRDLTINAIAMTENGDIIDPFGGRQDLRAKQLRHVSKAFTEDPLRVLRVARFCAKLHSRGFRVAAETKHLMQLMAQSGELRTLTPERVWQETVKALAEAHPEIYFQTLGNTLALAEIFPEIDALFGVCQRGNDGRTVSISDISSISDTGETFDTGELSLRALTEAARLSPDTDIRFAALLHDLGKPLTPGAKSPLPAGFEPATLPTIRRLCERLKTPKSTRELAMLVARHHTRTHDSLQLAAEEAAEEIVKLLDDCDVWRRPERFVQFLTACEAVARSRQLCQTPSYPPANFLLKAMQQCKQIDARELLKRGFEGLALKQQLQLERAVIIRRLKLLSLKS